MSCSTQLCSTTSRTRLLYSRLCQQQPQQQQQQQQQQMQQMQQMQGHLVEEESHAAKAIQHPQLAARQPLNDTFADVPAPSSCMQLLPT
jgi:hypothetical protein